MQSRRDLDAGDRDQLQRRHLHAEGPALLGGPLSEASEPQKQPGDTTTETSLLADVVDLPTHVGSAPAGGTYVLKWEFWAEARTTSAAR